MRRPFLRSGRRCLTDGPFLMPRFEVLTHKPDTYQDLTNDEHQSINYANAKTLFKLLVTA